MHSAGRPGARPGRSAPSRSGAADAPPVAAPIRIPLTHQIRMWLTGIVGSRYDGLHHFAVVEPGVLLRCGQPRLRELEEVHRDHGFRTIVAARGGTRHPLRGRWFRAQCRWCRARGIRLEHVPFSDSRMPPADIFDRFVEITSDPAARPVFVHCEQGIHRTGILCAAFRIAVQGWSLERAQQEMARFGFDLAAARSRPLADALRDWAGRLQTRLNPEAPQEHFPAASPESPA